MMPVEGESTPPYTPGSAPDAVVFTVDQMQVLDPVSVRRPSNASSSAICPGFVATIITAAPVLQP